MNNKITIKTERNFRVTFAVYSAVLFTVCAELVGGIVLAIKKDLNDFAMLQLVVLGFIGICCVGYIFSEVINRKKCIITENEIIKYKGKKIVFKINKNDIIDLMYKKPTVMMRILFLLGVIVRIPFVGILSIRYKNADIDEPRDPHSYEILDTLTDEEKQSVIKEYLELLSEREMKKISTVLNIAITYQ